MAHTIIKPAIRIFVSSVHKEFCDERRSIREFIENDPLLKQFFEVFLFEELPAGDQRTDQGYLDEVGQCTIYLGIFGEHYGPEDAEGLSSTEREFDFATQQCKYRLIFVKVGDDSGQHAKMYALVRKSAGLVVQRHFTDLSDLKSQISVALAEYLRESGILTADQIREKTTAG